MSSVNGLAMRNRAPALAALSRISGEPSEVTKPNGTADPEDAQRLQALDAGHVRHVPVRQDQVRLLRRHLGQRVGAVLGLDDVVVVVPGLTQRADDDLPHDAAVVGDEDLHSGTPFWLCVVQCWE